MMNKYENKLLEIALGVTLHSGDSIKQMDGKEVVSLK